MGALVAVAVGGAGADGRVADVIAGQHAAVAVGAVVGRENVHHVVHARADGRLPQLVGQGPVIGEAGVLGKDGDLVLVGVLVRAGGRDIQGQHVLHAFGQPGGAVADLLVGRKVEPDLPVQGLPALLKGLDCRQQHGHAGLIVHETGLEIAVCEPIAGLQGDHIAGVDAEGSGLLGAPHVLIQYDADVGAEVGRDAAQLLLRHVDGVGRAADGPGEDLAVPGVNADVLGHAVEGIEPAHRADVQRAVGVHMAHHEADIVQVGRDGQTVALAAQVGDHAALVGEPIGAAQLVQQAAQELLDLLILAGGAVHPYQLFKAVQAVFLVKRNHLLSSTFSILFLPALGSAGACAR